MQYTIKIWTISLATFFYFFIYLVLQLSKKISDKVKCCRRISYYVSDKVKYCRCILYCVSDKVKCCRCILYCVSDMVKCCRRISYCVSDKVKYWANEIVHILIVYCINPLTILLTKNTYIEYMSYIRRTI
jgi:hypothetical protein